MTRNPFGWDTANSRPILRVKHERAVTDVEIVACGADDPAADTMFCVRVDTDRRKKKRVITMRPEAMHIGFLRDVLEAGSFTLEVRDQQEEVMLDEERMRRIEKVQHELEAAKSPML